jgi:hypothetical protein
MSISDNKVTVLILTYNEALFTTECIASVLQSARVEAEVIVIDNGSVDDTFDKLKSNFGGRITLIRNEKNLGAAGGRNQGIECFLSNSKNRYLLLLDNDTILKKDTLYEMLHLLHDDPKIGVVAPFEYYYDHPDVISYAGGAYIDWGRGSFYGSMQGEARKTGEIVRELDVAPSGFILVKREVFERAGGFDSRYFIYFEDPDWCLRARKAGYKIAATSRAELLHRTSQSLGMETPSFYYYRTRNRFLFMEKNADSFHRLRFNCYFAYEFIMLTLPTLVLNKMWKQLKAVCAGIVDHLRGRYGEKVCTW